MSQFLSTLNYIIKKEENPRFNETDFDNLSVNRDETIENEYLSSSFKDSLFETYKNVYDFIKDTDYSFTLDKRIIDYLKIHNDKTPHFLKGLDYLQYPILNLKNIEFQMKRWVFEKIVNSKGFSLKDDDTIEKLIASANAYVSSILPSIIVDILDFIYCSSVKYPLVDCELEFYRIPRQIDILKVFKNGNLELCKYFYTNHEYLFSEQCIVNLVHENHLHVLKWLYSVNPQICKLEDLQNIKYNFVDNLETIKWLIDNSMLVIERHPFIYYFNMSLRVFKYIHSYYIEKYKEFNYDDFLLALNQFVEHSHVENFIYLIELYPNFIKQFRDNNNLNMVYLLKSNQYKNKFREDSLDIIKYLHSKKYLELDEPFFQFIVNINSIIAFKWFIEMKDENINVYIIRYIPRILNFNVNNNCVDLLVLLKRHHFKYTDFEIKDLLKNPYIEKILK